MDTRLRWGDSMVGVTIFIEGGATGPDSKYLQIRCREGFRKLISKFGLIRQPSLRACGGRGNAFKDFQNGHRNSKQGAFVALLIDSEDPVIDIEETWQHLQGRDGWKKPEGATNEQVLLMTTCMESWIATDRQALRDHFGAELRESALPPLHSMETRDRHSVQESLSMASRGCKNQYEKGKPSFELLGKLEPAELSRYLPSFERVVRVLKAKT